MQWATGVEVDELNWGTHCYCAKISIITNALPRVILIAAIERPERKIGDITVYKWMGKLPDEELIQRCIGDAVTG
ncbi:MAG: hypothetical protein M3352_07480 [Bacteroidota bacterium]|nr:hypothetical protein [Bacteroidota bacterium]